MYTYIAIFFFPLNISDYFYGLSPEFFFVMSVVVVFFISSSDTSGHFIRYERSSRLIYAFIFPPIVAFFFACSHLKSFCQHYRTITKIEIWRTRLSVDRVPPRLLLVRHKKLMCSRGDKENRNKKRYSFNVFSWKKHQRCVSCTMLIIRNVAYCFKRVDLRRTENLVRHRTC